MTTPNYTDALLINPFDGDYGDGEEIVIDEITIAPPAPHCHACGAKIKPGATIRRRVERIGRIEEADNNIEIKEFMWCETCVKAMCHENPDKFERRIELGFERDRPDEVDTEVEIGIDEVGEKIMVNWVRH